MTSDTPEVVVMGAAGFIGRHTARTLANKGLRVLGVGHGTWQEDEWRAWGLAGWLEADIGLDSLQRLPLQGIPRAIVHCGGSGAVSFSYAHPLEDFHRATQSTAAILEWARRHGQGACRVVLVSSAAVYGDQGDVDATENAARSPISPYGFHKMAAESICDSYSRFFAVPVSIVRLFSVYGEGLQKQLLWEAMNKLQRGEGEFFGTGHELRDWIHVEDAADLLARAGLARQSTFEIFNGGGDKATIRDLLGRLSGLANGPAAIVFNGTVHQGNPRRLTADYGHTMRLLDWQPRVGLDQGLARYAAWFAARAANGHDPHPPTLPAPAP